MLKKILSLIMCLAVFSAATLVFAEDVYITARGKKYHKQDCPFIANSNVQNANLEEVKTKGLEPCKRCFLSTKKQTSQEVSAKAKKDDLVYATANGKKYHCADCRLIKNRETKGMLLSDAQDKGLQPCSRCFLQEAKVE